MAWSERGTHVEATIDGFSKPDVFLVLALAAPPVLLGNAGWVGVDAGLASLHVAEDLHGVQGAALVGVDPVVSCSGEATPHRGSDRHRHTLLRKPGPPGVTDRPMGIPRGEEQGVRAACSQREGRRRERARGASRAKQVHAEGQAQGQPVDGT